MSSPSNVRVTCPSCGHEQDFSAWDSIDVVQSPELKERLLSGALTFLSCAKCGAERDVVYPLLYQDTVNRIAIRLAPGDDAADAPAGLTDSAVEAMSASYMLRKVRSLNALKEKVMIADAGLDDRAVELFKFFVRRDPDNGIPPDAVLLFGGVEEHESAIVAVFAVLRGEEQTAFLIPFDVLSRFADEAESPAWSLFKSDEPWLVVDEEAVAVKIKDGDCEGAEDE